MNRVSRRDVLITAGTATLIAGVATGGPPLCTAAASAPAAAAPPTSCADVYAKIRCSLGPELVPFWYRGTVMIALQDDFPRPILGVEGFSYARCQRDSDGSFRLTMTEAGYFTDLASGAILEEARNPLNGKLIKLRHFVSGAQHHRVRQDGSVESERRFTQPAEFSGRIGTPMRQGPEIWVDEDLLARISSDVLPPSLRDPGPARMLSLGSMTTYRSLARDVDDLRVTSAPCTFHLQELSSVPSWLELGDVVAKQIWRLSGRKLGSVAELPAALRARVERDHPVFISNPGI